MEHTKSTIFYHILSKHIQVCFLFCEEDTESMSDSNRDEQLELFNT